MTGAELVGNSIKLAERYCHTALKGVVLLLLPHSVELFLLEIGLVLIGRLPAILAWPTNRIDSAKYERNLLHQLRNLPAGQLITLPGLARNLDPGLPFRVTECAVANCERAEALFSRKLRCAAVPKKEASLDNGLPEDALFLQFSGGTTGDQKCVVVTAPMLVNQLEALKTKLQFDAADGVVSWLPLYHDMGLIACLWLPLWSGTPSTHFAATDWLMHPELLFELLAKYRGTFCWLPNFAFAYLAAQKQRIRGRFDLSHVRAFINCSEPVRQQSTDAFTRAFAGIGVRPEQCQACYAMAENVFALTQTQLDETPLRVCRSHTHPTKVPQGSDVLDLKEEYYVSSGQLLEGMSIRIRDAHGNLCGDGSPGNIEIKSRSLFCGYWGIHGFRAQSLANDGWYDTGDYGFTHQGELFVIGRAKDIIIVSGVNVFPEDLEALVSAVKGIYPGRVVAFGVDDRMQGTESVVIVAEMRGQFDKGTAEQLEHKIRHLVTSVFGIAVRYVSVKPERWIVKSTAGKISRKETRSRFLSELRVAVDPSGVET